MTNSAYQYDYYALFVEMEGHQTRIADQREFPEGDRSGQLKNSQVEDVDLLGVRLCRDIGEIAIA